jgi:hypothetical protein
MTVDAELAASAFADAVDVVTPWNADVLLGENSFGSWRRRLERSTSSTATTAITEAAMMPMSRGVLTPAESLLELPPTVAAGSDPLSGKRVVEPLMPELPAPTMPDVGAEALELVDAIAARLSSLAPSTNKEM